MLQALIFDVDGTLADTEEIHRHAFNHAFAAMGLGWYWDVAQYTRLLEVSGGKERMLHYWNTVGAAQGGLARIPTAAAIDRLHTIKTQAYADAINTGAAPLRPGVLPLIEAAQQQGLQLAIATTTTPANIAALLHRALGGQWRSMFAAIGDAESAPLKKPHPQVYLQTLAALQLPAKACLALEDSANGLQASLAAGLATVITPTRYTAGHNFAGAMQVMPDLSHTSLAELTAALVSDAPV